MSSVEHIKQKAIEIANNSISEIIIGIINYKDEQIINNDFTVVESYAEDFFYFDYKENVISAREQRLAERRERRLRKRNGY